MFVKFKSYFSIKGFFIFQFSHLVLYAILKDACETIQQHNIITTTTTTTTTTRNKNINNNNIINKNNDKNCNRAFLKKSGLFLGGKFEKKSCLKSIIFAQVRDHV